MIEENILYDFSDLKPLETTDEDLVQVEWIKYYKEVVEKKQIVLHHTVSGPGIDGDLATWKQFTDHIATCVIIGREGKINQLFPSKYWGWHLGVGKKSLDSASIGVELDNWGGLYEKHGELYTTAYNSKVDVPVCFYPQGFRGIQLFEAYTEKQLRSLGELILLWNKIYNIPLNYNELMWDVNSFALGGEPGVWTHVSYRPYPQKNDCHPDKNLINLLKTLKKLV
jgi:N-acetyl-anhydromuramyl-L-alanine amidase AmpD